MKRQLKLPNSITECQQNARGHESILGCCGFLWMVLLSISHVCMEGNQWRYPSMLAVEEAYFFLSPLQGATNPEFNSISFTQEYIHLFQLSTCKKLMFKFSVCPIHTLCFSCFFQLGKNLEKRTFCVKCEIHIRICIFNRKKLHSLKDL